MCNPEIQVVVDCHFIAKDSICAKNVPVNEQKDNSHNIVQDGLAANYEDPVRQTPARTATESDVEHETVKPQISEVHYDRCNVKSDGNQLEQLLMTME